MNTNIERLEIVAAGLGPLLKQAVFVGGATASLYIDTKGAPEFRPTEDVDCIVEVRSKKHFDELSSELRRKGFANDSRAGAPICRWIYKNITVDVMPLADDILGFSNRWYDQGYKECEEYSLPSGTTIKILSLAYFIATKLEAFRSRGQNDYRGSSDIEDIVLVIDGCSDCANKLISADRDVTGFLREQFSALSQDRDFIDAVYGCLNRSERVRAERILAQVQNFCASDRQDR
jgi:predicted nucleotidyltransferase